MKKLILTLLSTVLLMNILSAQCFTKNWTGYGLDQMNFYVTLATHNSVNLQIGDEIAIFDGEDCVGVGTLIEELTGGSVYMEIKASTDDPGTTEKDGFTVNNAVSYKFCQSGQILDFPVSATYISGEGVFSSSATAMVELRSEEVNNSPVINSPLADQNLALGFGTFDINLGIVFSDPDGDPITFTVTNSDDAVVTAAISGTTLTLTDVGIGTTTVEVCASDGNLSVCDEFEVIVYDPNACTLPASWTVRPNDFDFNGEIVIHLYVDEVPVTSGYLGAFVGDECRGVIEGNVFPLSGDFIFTLICYSNEANGEMLELKYFDIQNCQVVEPLDPPVEFTSDMVMGTASEPEVISSCVNYVKSFVVGWNWFSVNATLEDMSLSNVLSCTVEGDYIKNQVESATFYEGLGWYGALETIDPMTFYKLKAINACGIDYCGVPENPLSSPITLVDGWNWIGYLPQEAISISEALESLTLEETDYIKNQVESATYYDGLGWYGALEEMQPGDGYMVKKVSADILTYPESDGGSAKAAISSSPIALPNNISFNPGNFEYSGNITAKIMMDGSQVEDNDLVLAFAGNECRGFAGARTFAGTGEIAFPFLIYSNIEEGEEIQFKFYDASSGRLYECNEALTIGSDMIIADAYNPYVLTINSITSIQDNSDEGSGLSLYPNPVSDVMQIQYTVERESFVEITIYDITGKIVSVLESSNKNPGNYTISWNVQNAIAGTHVIKFKAGNQISWNKIMVSN